MDLQTALAKLLRSYERYYNINRETPAEPFAAEAEFRLHDEQYFLLKSAKISELDSNEFVYFAVTDRLDEQKLQELDRQAWETGLSRVNPGPGHKNSDVILVILTNGMDEAAARLVRKTKHSKNYRFLLHGWSNYRLIAYEVPTGKMAFNRLGQSLEKLLSNINQ